MGLGTRTNIYAGVLRLKSEEDEEMSGYTQEVKVVLKVLGLAHRDISLVRKYTKKAADLNFHTKLDKCGMVIIKLT